MANEKGPLLDALEEVRKRPTLASLALAARSAKNTRPAAPVEGLETVGAVRQETIDGVALGQIGLIHQVGYDQQPIELVTRSQAEAIIAAKDETWKSTYDDLHEEYEKLEADNAALTARVKELENERYNLAYAITGGEDAPGYLDSLSVETLAEVARDNTRRWFAETDRAEALETQLAAAKKALEEIAALSAIDMTLGDQLFAVTSARAALRVIP